MVLPKVIGPVEGGQAMLMVMPSLGVGWMMDDEPEASKATKMAGYYSSLSYLGWEQLGGRPFSADSGELLGNVAPE